jgi:hypothetical protein
MEQPKSEKDTEWRLLGTHTRTQEMPCSSSTMIAPLQLPLSALTILSPRSMVVGGRKVGGGSVQSLETGDQSEGIKQAEATIAMG